MPWLDKVKAVLDAWYPGQRERQRDRRRSSTATRTRPASCRRRSRRRSADLPTQTPEQYPGVDENGIRTAVYSEGLQVGYRWFDAQGHRAAVPVRLRPLVHDVPLLGPDGRARRRRRARVSFTVTNTGNRAGAEVAQVYVGFPRARPASRRSQLKGFHKVALEPGQSKHGDDPARPRARSRTGIRPRRNGRSPRARTRSSSAALRATSHSLHP